MPHNDSILNLLTGQAPPNPAIPLAPDAMGRSVAGKRPMMPISSVINAILGNESSIPRYADQAEDFILEALKNPGAGRLGMARGPMSSSTNLGGRQLRTINQVEDWLNRSGIEYSLNMNRSGANSVYIYARHPSTNEQVAIRVPRDGHIGYVDQRAQAKYKDTNRPGNFFDTGHTITNTNRPPQPEFVGNVGGEPYHNMDALFDALSHRFSRNPTGQFLVSPGREPHYPSERLTPIPMTQPPMMWGNTIRREPPPSAVMNTLGRSNMQNGRIVLPPRRPRQLELPLR